MADSFSGKTAVITGAASGIGAGLAREAAKRGMKVVLADRDTDRLEQVASAIGTCALAVPTDVTQPADVDALAAAAWEAHGRVDLLFNNAGVLSTGLCWEIPADQWQRALDVNIMGIVNGLRAFVPRMIAAGKPSRIVNTSSTGGFMPSPLLGAYSATKFAVVALTEALAGELEMVGALIAVSLLAPGPVKSGIFRAAPPTSSKRFHDAMVSLLADHGAAPDDFAARVFDGIERGDYWLIPQPEAFDAGFAARNALIAARQAPQFFRVEGN